MSFGCGIDIEEISRFKKHLTGSIYESLFVQQVYSEKEITNYLAAKRPDLLLPLGFSCKESCFKALGVSWTNSPIGWKDIEVFFQPDFEITNSCKVQFSGYALKLFWEMKYSTIENSFQVHPDYVIFKTIIY